jgi:hypothetical protein
MECGRLVSSHISFEINFLFKEFNSFSLPVNICTSISQRQYLRQSLRDQVINYADPANIIKLTITAGLANELNYN